MRLKKTKQKDVLRDEHHRLKEGGEGEGGGGTTRNSVVMHT